MLQTFDGAVKEVYGPLARTDITKKDQATARMMVGNGIMVDEMRKATWNDRGFRAETGASDRHCAVPKLDFAADRGADRSWRCCHHRWDRVRAQLDHRPLRYGFAAVAGGSLPVMVLNREGRVIIDSLPCLGCDHESGHQNPGNRVVGNRGRAWPEDPWRWRGQDAARDLRAHPEHQRPVDFG
ncbi:hypothetical protein WCLP8_4870003 [uncultured Gammaproteobacteria bacterium]